MRLATIAWRPCVGILFAIVLFLTTGLSSIAHAQFHPGVKIAFHAQPVSKFPACEVGAGLAAENDCRWYTTDELPLDRPLHVYVIVAGKGTAGFTSTGSGITYDEAPWSGVDIFEWTKCAGGLDLPRDGPNGTWPAAGSANLITWLACQQTVPPGGDFSQALAWCFLRDCRQQRRSGGDTQPNPCLLRRNESTRLLF